MATATTNPLRALLEQGKPGFGAGVNLNTPHAVQVLCRAGYDWLFIDTEHSPTNINDLYGMLLATQGTDVAPIVRLPWQEHWLAKPVLDAGARGIIFPMVNTAEQAAACAAAMRYPPTGERGFAPFYAALLWNQDWPTYTDAADRDVLCFVLIEHAEAVANIEAIAAVPGVDGCLIAPYDLAMSYHVGANVGHEKVQAGIREVERAVLASGKWLGGRAEDATGANALLERGYHLVFSHGDTGLLQRGAATFLNALNRPGE